MKLRRPQIFLSSASKEFRPHRELLARDLSGPDSLYAVVEQQDFTVGGASLLEQLDNYISACSAVVHLVGERSGEPAKPGEVHSLLNQHPDFLASWPELKDALGDFSDLSYTQWEAYLALHHGVPCFVFLSEPFARAAEVGTVPDRTGSGQRAHFARLAATGKHYDIFASADRLSVMIHRTLSKLLSHTPTDVVAPTGGDLPRWHERFISEADSIAPIAVRIGLPYHLVAGTALRTEIELSNSGPNPLEDLTVQVRLGSASAAYDFAHLPTGGVRTAVGDITLSLEDTGAKTLRIDVGVTRGALRESFYAEAAVEVGLDAAVFPPGAGPRVSAHLYSASTGSNLIAENRRHGTQFKQIPLKLGGEAMERRVGVGNLVLMPIPAAGRRFIMGNPGSAPNSESDEIAHPVRFTRSWWMARFPISQRQFEETMGHNPALFAEPSGSLPVETVSWGDACEFCRRHTQRERSGGMLPPGFRYRLPTEAEWEFACRAGGGLDSYGATTRSKTSGRSQDARRPSQTLPLDGGRGANRWGLCDMLGNVFEWTADAYAPYRSEGVQEDPLCEGDADSPRVIRGGSWQDPVEFCHPTVRVSCPPDRKSGRIGFRVVLARD